MAAFERWHGPITCREVELHFPKTPSDAPGGGLAAVDQIKSFRCDSGMSTHAGTGRSSVRQQWDSYTPKLVAQRARGRCLTLPLVDTH